MGRSSAAPISSDARRAAESLAADLRRLFGARLQSVVAYGFGDDSDDGLLHTLALVERVTFDDLAACVPLTSQWQRRGLHVPLLLSRDEFTRSLDAFALEYGAIVARHALVEGPDPFAQISIADDDVRRACERQAKSHLIHLREGFLEAGGDARAVAALIAASVPAFELLLVNLARLDAAGADDAGRHRAEEDDAARAAGAIGLAPGLLEEIRSSRASGTIVDPTALLSRYMAAAERTWRYVDAWRARG
jgi:hypothetical protein